MATNENESALEYFEKAQKKDPYYAFVFDAKGLVLNKLSMKQHYNALTEPSSWILIKPIFLITKVFAWRL